MPTDGETAGTLTRVDNGRKQMRKVKYTKPKVLGGSSVHPC
jgi:hypothetical protein